MSKLIVLVTLSEISPNLFLYKCGRHLSDNKLDEKAKAMIKSRYLGQESIHACPDALFVDYNPGGKFIDGRGPANTHIDCEMKRFR